MLINGLRMAHLAVRVAWLAGTMALLGLITLPHVLPAVGREVFVVRGASMQPAIPLGALVVVRGVDPAQVHVGDVVTYRLEQGAAVTHRVTAIVDQAGLAFQTKGDASESGDAVAVPAAALIGAVEYVVPGMGMLMVTLGSTTGAVIAVGVLGSLLMLTWLIEELMATARPWLARTAVAERAG